ncbi:MAG: NCS2 family permease [Marinifilaceae bacterium]|jgi:AGZA family xanthine/uracil permease-like MFS transporter|nr:NCS2 family permease [Marinifilaceae bacterium]
MKALDNFFGISKSGSTFKTEIVAGITTFMTMAYILAVNPSILSVAMGKENMGAIFTATVLAAIIGTVVMALVAKLPFALAPGMGLNAFFAFTVVAQMGYSWQFALTAVLLEGIIFIVLTATNIREIIVNIIPVNIKYAVSSGIGLFIAFIGLKNAGIIVANDATFVSLAPNIFEGSVLVCLIGILLTGVLYALKVKGALLIGIFVSTIIGIPFGITPLPENVVSTPPSVSNIFCQFEWDKIFTTDMAIVLFTFLFVDMFDTVGTLIGVTSKAGMLTKDNKVPRVKQALFADAIATTCGAVLGTSTVTTYVESASGVAEGGRTGMTALSTACMFFLALFLSPIFLMIPAAATAPALFIVGLFMMSPIKNIDFEDFTEALPAFFTVIMMPLCYSIADGIIFGMLSYVLLKLFTGRFKDISIPMYLLAALFILKFIYM